jgi:hypothetical protein
MQIGARDIENLLMIMERHIKKTPSHPIYWGID